MNANKSTSKWLAVIVVLQSLTLLTQWTSSSSGTPAMAQIPDAGDQRNQLIDQAKATNEKLDKLLDVLKSGELQVKVVRPDDSKGHE